MPESLLVLLKWCVVALLYLFFVAVLRTVWADLRPSGATEPTSGPAPRPTDKSATAPTAKRARTATRSRTATLAEVTATNAEGVVVGTTFSLTDELTIGRAAGCHIHLDDGFVSGLHARLTPHGSGALIDDLGSTNGTRLNGAPVTEATEVSIGDEIQVGSTTLLIR